MARQSGPRGGGRRPSGKQGGPRSKSGGPPRPGGKRPAGKAAFGGPSRPGGKRPPGKGKPAPSRPARPDRQPAQAREHDHAEGPGKPERLQKILAHAGLGSRRECEEYILQGRITVDGKVVRELGTRVDPEQAAIAVDGEKIRLERMVYFAVNKPKGYVSTNDDPAGRPRVIDLLPEVPERVYSVGRLDEDSTGLMLLTNDGELANKLAHPRYGVEKTYRALVAGSPSPEVIRKLSEGIWLSEGKVRAKRARVVGTQGEATQLELVLAEGKKREIRRMLAKFGHKVMSLTRIAIGPIVLKGLAAGEHRPLSRTEVELLRKVAAGIEVSPPRFLTQGGAPKRAPKRSSARHEGPEGPVPRSRRNEARPPRPAGRRDRERPEQDHAAETRPPRDRAARPHDRPRPGKPGTPKPMPGKPVASRPAHDQPPAAKPIPGKPPTGKPPVVKPPTGKAPTSRPKAETSRPLPGRRPAQPAPAPAPAPPPPVARTKTAEPGPRRRIIGLAPRVADEAGLSVPSKPPRKRPMIRRKPPRRVFGIRRPDEGGGQDES